MDAICRDGFVIAQEYVTEATGCDTCLFTMNGEGLE
ncbi:hypothetical protein [Bizionia myxarmorum]